MTNIAVRWLIFPLGSFPLPEEWLQMGKISEITQFPCATFSSLVCLTGTLFNKTVGSRLDLAGHPCPL